MKRTYFLQKPAEIVKNQYEDDFAFQQLLHRIIPKEILKEFENDLKQLGLISFFCINFLKKAKK